MKVFVGVAGVALIVAVANVFWVMREPPKLVAPSVTPRPDENPVAEHPRALPPTVDVRAQLKQVVAENRPQLRSTGDVERYLGDLRARARRNHQVTAFEVEPGLAAIREQYDPEHAIERTQRFADEMAALSAELDGRREEPPPDLDRLARDLEHASDEARRQDLIRQYSQAILALSPEEQPRRVAWLNEHARR
jgi:hypothetical protein